MFSKYDKAERRDIISIVMKKRYELTDEQWEQLKDMLPDERKPQGGRPAKNNDK